MELVFSGTIIPLLNEHIMQEYKNVLSRPKFHMTEIVINDILTEINRLGLYIDAEKIDIVLPDPKDRIFYEVVMEKRKEEEAYLVTGNIKHFPTKPYVVTPRQMIDIIIENYGNIKLKCTEGRRKSKLLPVHIFFSILIWFKVIRYQKYQALYLFCSGRRALNSTFPSAHPTSIFPPWAVTIVFAMASPRP